MLEQFPTRTGEIAAWMSGMSADSSVRARMRQLALVLSLHTSRRSTWRCGSWTVPLSAEGLLTWAECDRRHRFPRSHALPMERSPPEPADASVRRRLRSRSDVWWRLR
jgi:hypothetical protein